MDLEGQQDPQEEQPQEQPIDPRAALELAAQQFGVSPEVLESSLRLQNENQRVYEENRRRARELELKEAQFEALTKERSRYLPPEPQYEVDPVVRPIFDKVNSLERIIMDERRERADAEQRQREAQQMGSELHNHFETVMRGVPSQNQIDQKRFFGGMAELWPDELPPGMTPARAVEITARYLGIQSNGIQSPQPYRGNPYRDPRASFVIPGAPSVPTAGPQGVDTSPKRPEETIEQYSQRIEAAGRALQRQLQDSGVRSLPDRY